MKTSIYVDEAARDVLEALGGPTEAVRGLLELLAQARRALESAFSARTTALEEVLGEKMPPLPLPPIVISRRASWTGWEPASLQGLIEEWAALQVGPARRFFEALTDALWGQALGRALGFDFLHSVALGEFCRAWVAGLSCRFGNLDAHVEALEEAFVSGLTGRLQTGPVLLLPEGLAASPRRLFPFPGEDPAPWRRAWRVCLTLLRMFQEGRAQVQEDGPAVLADGRRAVEAALQATV